MSLGIRSVSRKRLRAISTLFFPVFEPGWGFVGVRILQVIRHGKFKRSYRGSQRVFADAVSAQDALYRGAVQWRMVKGDFHEIN
jgi:hypothetical protein